MISVTLNDIERMDADFLTVAEVAKFLRCEPQLIRDQAERDPKYLGFNISRFGHAFRIPRLAFVAWMKGQVPVIAYTVSGEKKNC